MLLLGIVSDIEVSLHIDATIVVEISETESPCFRPFSFSVLTLAACAPTEWSRRRNVVGVAVPALVMQCWHGLVIPMPVQKSSLHALCSQYFLEVLPDHLQHPRSFPGACQDAQHQDAEEAPSTDTEPHRL